MRLRVYHALVVAYHYINFLSNGKKFLKKGIILWSSACYIKCRWSVTCCFRKISATMQFCWKNIFFSMQEDYASFSSTLVISVLCDMNLKCNLFGHMNKFHHVRQKFFLWCKKSHSIFLQQNRLHFMLIGYSKPIK